MLQSLNSLYELDFLPEQYRQRSEQRRAYFWRIAAVSLFASFFLITAFLQRRHHVQMEARLLEVESQYAGALADNARLAEIQTKLQAHRSTAEFHTYLRHVWPRTQILAAVMDPLPDSITFTDWQIGHEAVIRSGPLSPPSPEAELRPWTKLPAARHLKRLMHENANRQHFVFLVGHASEAAALHEYLANLGTNPLFAKIDLRSIENVPPERAAGRIHASFHFSARAILRVSNGQTIQISPTVPANTASPQPLAGMGR